jgi:hypothetical protein
MRATLHELLQQLVLRGWPKIDQPEHHWQEGPGGPWWTIEVGCYALGDVTNAPNAKTAAAARKQAPVVAHNLLKDRGAVRGADVAYDGYGSCPLTVERGKIVLAEFARLVLDAMRQVLKLVGKRRRLLKYLERNDLEAYRSLVSELNLRS